MNKALLQQALEALVIAEAGLADIGDADREPGDDLAWCEARAAQALAFPRAAIIALSEAIAQPEQPSLQAAAQAVLDRWDSPQWEWATHGPTADLMHVLREAIAQPTDGNRTSVDSGALKLALNVLRRAGKDATADALQETATREPIAQPVQPASEKKKHEPKIDLGRYAGTYGGTKD